LGVVLLLVVVVVVQERYNKICPPVKANTLDVSLINPNYINSLYCGGVGCGWGLVEKCVFVFYAVVVLQGLRTPTVSEIRCMYSSAIFVA
jgi:hypothetical protein